MPKSNQQILKEGGSAFPMGYHPEGNPSDWNGMTLRQWYAGLAMQAIVGKFLEVNKERQSIYLPNDIVCSLSFRMADAMLKNETNENKS